MPVDRHSMPSLIDLLLPPLPSNSTLPATLLPHTAHYPFYLSHSDSLLPFLSDRYTAVLTPVIVYWLLGGLFHFLDAAQFPYFEKRRIHESEEVTKRNRVTFPQVPFLPSSSALFLSTATDLFSCIFLSSSSGPSFSNTPFSLSLPFCGYLRMTRSCRPRSGSTIYTLCRLMRPPSLGSAPSSSVQRTR